MARANFTDANIADLEITGKKYDVRDTKLPGLYVRVEGSGAKSFYYVYSLRSRVRWYRIGPVEMGASAARQMAKELIGDVARGRDPQAERTVARGGVTFEQLHARFIEEWSQKRNKSWRQAEKLIKANVLPKWGNMTAKEISRAQVKALVGKLSADRPVLANQVRYAISAVFSFGVREEVLAVNPCLGIEANETTDRDRVLSPTEVPEFWRACDDAHPIIAAALRVVLLTGQRPGEVSHMRLEHIKGNWWEMPGKPVREHGWPGTKNGASHRVYLADEVLKLIEDGEEGFVFATGRGNSITGLTTAMQAISKACKFDPPVRPHDLRRSFGTMITERGHGREALDRILNHREKSVTDVYDRHNYAKADEHVMRDVVAHVLRLVAGASEEGKVIAGRFGKRKK